MAIGVVTAGLYAAIVFVDRAISPLHAASGVKIAIGLYVAVTVAMFVAYAAVVSLAASGALRGRRVVTLALGFPVLIAVALAVARPYLSTDVFTYLAQARQVNTGHNPYTEPVRTIARTSFGRELEAEGWPPVHDVSPYGPLWTRVEAIIGRLAGDIPTGVLIIKLVVTAAALGCGWLVWAIAGLVRPESRVTAAILYIWNPTVILELAGEGHNEALVVLAMLLSIYLALRSRVWQSVVAVGAGVLIKIVAGILVPLELYYVWRMAREGARPRLVLAGQILVGTGVVVLLAIVTYGHLWTGMATFGGVRDHARPNLMSASTPAVLYWYLTRSHSEAAAVRFISIAVGAAFALYTAWAARSIADARTFVTATGRVAIAFVVLAPGYWPWYAAIPIALLALTADDMAVWGVLALTLGSRLAAPLDALRIDGLLDWDQEIFSTTLVGVWVPAAVIGLTALRRAVPRTSARYALADAWRHTPAETTRT